MKVKEPPAPAAVRVRTGVREPESGPETNSMVTGPLASIHSSVKGLPSWTANSVFVMAGFARPMAAKAPTRTAESFIVMVV